MLCTTLKSVLSYRNFHCTRQCLMPKKKQAKEVASTTSRDKVEAVTSAKSGVEIKVLAKPGAKTNSVTDISETVGIQIAAPPVDGEANTELVRYLSKVLGVKKSQVTIDKGSKSRNKTVIVTGSSVEDVLEKMRLEITH